MDDNLPPSPACAVTTCPLPPLRAAVANVFSPPSSLLALGDFLLFVGQFLFVCLLCFVIVVLTSLSYVFRAGWFSGYLSNLLCCSKQKSKHKHKLFFLRIRIINVQDPQSRQSSVEHNLKTTEQKGERSFPPTASTTPGPAPPCAVTWDKLCSFSSVWTVTPNSQGLGTGMESLPCDA